ncbi:MAG: phosphomannomutase/phosphoglucomutase [Anaerolineae bacterium]|nr:phosphomannomutase/phosphoglucomutase [Anaerolineae bacterium]NUQ06989.1 phosphomannomutase/phosphoglucomutase [Anaerolineae bacterium]
MAQLDPKLFKKYDIRGRAAGENAPLDATAASLIGKAFGTYLFRTEGKRRVIVGRDNRGSSPELMQALIEGLTAAGCDVVTIALASTPLVYWYAVHHDNAGGVMVTGSHLAPEQNGFKLCVGARNLYGESIQALLKLILAGDFDGDIGSVSAKESAVVDYMVDVVPRLRMRRPLHVVVDAGNGTGGYFGPRLLRAWGHRVTELFCELDGSYPNHQPDPQETENMRFLSARVREVGADLGIAFDGDADRLGIVDEHGGIIGADRILTLLARDMLSRNSGAAVIADVLTSQVLFDEVARLGGVPVMWASGHSLVKAKMVETDALLGGEASGHIFLGENYYGFDDAYFAAGLLLRLIGNAPLPLSALNASIPTLFSTPEYRPRCPDEMKVTVIDAARQALDGQGEMVSVDGLRIRFERGWGLLRASNTEPVLSLRFEAESEADAYNYRDRFFEVLRRFPEVEKVG